MTRVTCLVPRMNSFQWKGNSVGFIEAHTQSDRRLLMIEILWLRVTFTTARTVEVIIRHVLSCNRI